MATNNVKKTERKNIPARAHKAAKQRTAFMTKFSWTPELKVRAVDLFHTYIVALDRSTTKSASRTSKVTIGDRGLVP